VPNVIILLVLKQRNDQLDKSKEHASRDEGTPIQRNKETYYMGREQNDGLGTDRFPVTGLRQR
jgi:hypothetical protein